MNLFKCIMFILFVKKRIKSVKYCFQGLWIFFSTQHSSWVQAPIALMTILLGFYLKINVIEWCFVVGAIGLVFVAEIINTAIEFLTDLVSPDYHQLAGKVKDLAAGAVLLAAITAAIIGGIVFIPKL